MITNKVTQVLILFLIILIPIFIEGCLEESEKEDYILVYDNLSSYNFTLSISTDKQEYQPGENVSLKISLTNMDNQTFKLFVSIFYYPNISIIVPNGSKYEIYYGKGDLIEQYEKSSKGDILTNSVDLNLHLFMNETENLINYVYIDFSSPGVYKCFASIYYLESNSWEFKVK